ncbi:hypothetical protein KKQ91_13150 [Clostridioides difficile]|nr:hypothetical protein [Clostridioides difficile]
MLKIIILSGILSSIIKLPIIGILPTGNIKKNTGINDSKKMENKEEVILGYQYTNYHFLYSPINNSVPSNKPIPPEEIRLIKIYLLKSCI